MKTLISAAVAATIAATALAAAPTGNIAMENVEFFRTGDTFNVKLDYVLDSLRLGANRQILVTPIVEGAGGEQAVLPTVLINGRNMHYAYERGTVRRRLKQNYDISTEVRRMNGKPQTVSYRAETPFRDWMYATDASISLRYDTCGCGRLSGQDMLRVPLELNPVGRMTTAWLTPQVTELPVAIHEGKARVQFEVDKTELHPEPYVCRNGQRIDNRAQLALIEDSIRYATTDPNVEISRIEITGFASPESPYTHNDFLATNRSRALAEYIGKRFNLSPDVTAYGAVPENWAEFRQQVADAKDITEKQRADLLALIDRPAYGPADYDEKERELRTDPRFATLYKQTILPKWFPQLRATKFAISTRLKPMADEKLAEVILQSPEKMSLNQMFRVARLYPEDSPEFRRTIETALKYYPDSEEANTNAAVWEINSGNYDRAAELLKRAGDNPEAENARGILATKRGDFTEALKHFDAAGNLPEARHNKSLLE